MSDVLRDYHFDSLKKFATTLKYSEWSEVNEEIADYYLQQLNKKYQQVLLDTRALGRDPNISDEAERIYGRCKGIIEAHVAKMSRSGPAPQYFGVETHVESEMPQQPGDVGYFSGEFIDWCEFLERFNTIVHSNNQLGHAEKLRRLLAAVTGKAARVLGHWPIHDTQYVPAINKLRAVYGNKYLIACSHIEAMEARPPIDSTYESITELIMEVEKMKNDFRKMEMPAGHWETTIVTCIQKRLDERSKESWIGIRHGDPTGMPTLSDMMSFLRGRALALPSTNGSAQSFWSPKMNRNSPPPSANVTTFPKVETKKSRNSGPKALKNGDCYICQSTVLDDAQECRDCPAMVHFCCLRNADVVRNRKEAKQWKCKNCLRCAECHSTSKIVSFLLKIDCLIYRFQCFCVLIVC